MNPFKDLEEALRWWTDENHTAPDFAKMRREIARITRSPRRRAAIEESALNLLSTPEEQISDRTQGGRAAREAGFSHLYGALDPSLRRLVWNYAIADAMALYYQRPQSSASHKIAAYVALAGTGVWLFSRAGELFPDAPAIVANLPLPSLVGAALIVVFTSFSLRFRIRFKQIRHRFLMARTLAETLRVEFFQRLAGTGFHTAEVFRAHHETTSVPSWTLRILEAAIASSGEKPGQPPGEIPTPDPVRLQWTEDYWVESQHRYYGKPKVDGSISGATGRETEAARAAERWLRFNFIATAFTVVASLALMLAPTFADLPFLQSRGAPDGERIRQIVLIPRHISELMAGLLGIAATLFHQRSSLHAVIARKYRRAALVLAEARHHLSASNLSPANRLAALRYIAYQAIAETTDWGVHQREQPIHVAFR